VNRVSLAFVLVVAVTGALCSERAPAVERVSRVSLSQLELKLLERVNAARLSLGLARLRLSPELLMAAQHHADDMARNGFCGHDSADGTSFWNRVRRFYRPGSGWRSWSAAENVTCHPRRLTAAAALGRWLASPSHRANLLAPKWRDVGLAAVWARAAPGRFGGRDVFLVTANFGSRS
jgi:uncharacterized protein YkwD